MRDLNASIARYQDKKKKKKKNLEGPQPKVKGITEIVRDLGDMEETVSR